MFLHLSKARVCETQIGGENNLEQDIDVSFIVLPRNSLLIVVIPKASRTKYTELVFHCKF